MTDTLLIGIGLLLVVSLLVRVAPAFVPLPLSDEMAERIETVLPVAVFVNLAAYCAVSEIDGNTVAGIAGFVALLILLPLIRRIGLVIVVALGTGTYLLAREHADWILGSIPGSILGSIHALGGLLAV